jgi:NitT/TauT family transport system ATP-binding protein
MARVTVKNLWKRYGDTVVLENINLEFADHEFVTIVGASGCGKTTFLRILLGMEQPSRGKLLIDGKAVPPEPGRCWGISSWDWSCAAHGYWGDFSGRAGGRPWFGPRVSWKR